MRSLERLLQAGLAVSILVLAGVLLLVGNRSVKQLTEDFIVSRLEHDADSLLSALVVDRRPHIRPNRINAVYHQPYSGHYYVVLFVSGERLVSRSLWDQSIDIPMLGAGESKRLHTQGPSLQPLLLWVKGVSKQGVSMTIAVGEDVSAIDDRRDAFFNRFIVLSLAGLLLLMLVQTIVIRHSFRRLETVRRDIKRLEQGKTQQLSEDVPTEILPLVQEFNRLLLLLSQRLERSRNALGNLAHALKGPLNLAGRYFHDTDGGDPERTQAGLQIDRIRQLMDRELKRARLAGRGLPVRRFDAGEEMPDLIKVLKQVYADRDLSVQWRAQDELPPFGDREDMLELIGNLLDNACKWAQGKVSCGFANDGVIHIRIEDDGGGISDADIDGLTERGVRLDESVDGHGLGLAIAKDIVNLYGGEIRFSRSERYGGLLVHVSLPLDGR